MKDKESAFIEQSLALDSYLTTLLCDTTVEEFIPQPAKEMELEIPGGKEASTIDSIPPHDFDSAESKKQSCIEVLPFIVDKLNLLANMDDLAGAVDMVNELAAVSGQPDWFMGLADCEGRRVGIIDSALLIVGTTNNTGNKYPEHHYKKILLLKNSAWGIACGEIGKSYHIETDAVRWRTKKKSRPWLLGTLADQAGAIIDVNQLVQGQ
ncbi:MAG: chemotaxis protein CheW [Methylococcales bacterium]